MSYLKFPLRESHNDHDTEFTILLPQNVQNHACSQSQKESQIETNDLTRIECIITFSCRLFLLRLVFVSVWKTSEAWHSSGHLEERFIRLIIECRILCYLVQWCSSGMNLPWKNNCCWRCSAFLIQLEEWRRPDREKKHTQERAQHRRHTVPVKSVPLRNVKTEIIGWMNEWRKTMAMVHVQQKAGIILMYLQTSINDSLFPFNGFLSSLTEYWTNLPLLDYQPVHN